MENLVPSIKKQIRNYFVIALGTLGLTCATNASAGQIIDYAVVGPGLGYYEEITEIPGEIPGGFEVDFGIYKEFDYVEYIDLIFLVENNGGPTETIIYEEIFNNTFIDWTDYHLELGYVDIGDCGNLNDCDYEFITPTSELYFLGQLNSAFDNENHMPDDYPNTLWLDDGIVPDYDYFQMLVGINIPDVSEATPEGALYDCRDCYTFALRQTPTTGAVPEPSIIALFAAGLFGIGFARRRKA